MREGETENRRVGQTGKLIRHFRHLEVYQNALSTGLHVYELGCIGRSKVGLILTKKFPAEERYALTDHIRRSSRSVCANIAEAWRKRRYAAAFISKLSDSDGEAAETQVHIEFAFRHGCISNAECGAVDNTYEHIFGQLVRMIDYPEKWVIGMRKNR